MSRLDVVRPTRLTSDEIADVTRIAADVTAAAAAPPLSDHVLSRLRRPAGDGRSHLLLRDGDAVVGYAHRDPGAPATAEIVVALDASVHERITTLLSAVVDDSPDGVRIWAHGERSSIAPVLQELGFTPARVLLRLRRPLDDSLPEPQWPVGVSVRTFEIGVDEPAWLEVNNRAFATHADQAGWSLEEIQAREAELWFDPDGFFLAMRGEEVVGFHWTKIHDGPPPIGEVYVLAVDPSMRGQQLGPPLTMQGMRYLRDRGMDAVMLYVDESNGSAVRLYEQLGFHRADTDVCFSKR